MNGERLAAALEFDRKRRAQDYLMSEPGTQPLTQGEDVLGFLRGLGGNLAGRAESAYNLATTPSRWIPEAQNVVTGLVELGKAAISDPAGTGRAIAQGEVQRASQAAGSPKEMGEYAANFIDPLRLAKALRYRGPILEAAPNYRMAHRPMTVEGGAARLDNAYEAFGEDIYGPNALRYFGGSDPREAGTVAALKRLRDNPEAEVTIYRGVPADAKGGITKGDWVTLDRSAAQEYAELKPGQKGKVLAMKVKAKDVTTWPDSLLEFGYYPAE